ncbi:MAG: hypothetical protein II712_01030, partial [Erysipelotrichaceae bacterium]|nr:hypothetical protein [Erysipelotrichaceae bacterium]
LDSQTMEKLDEYQLTKTLRRMSDYGDFEFVAVMNLWDLHFDGLNLYMTAENGVIYAMDRDGLWDEYSCAIIEDEELMTRIINNRNGGGIWIKDVVVIDETESEDIQDVSTGKMNKAYMSYRIADDDGSHLLISCYLGDPYCAAQYDQSDYPAAVAVFNKETSQIESRIVLDGYPGYEYQKPCFGRYSDQDVVCVLSDMQENPKATLYSLAGETVLQKTLVLGEVLKPLEGMLALSWDGTSYLLEIFDGPSVVLGSDLESKGYLFESIEYVFLSELNGNLFFKKKVNGAVRGLICYDSQMNVIWQYDYSAAYKNSGIDEISWGFYNNDKISDFLLLASQYDSKDTLVSTYFIVLDGASGKVLLNRNLKLGTYRDSNNKKHDYYLTASTASLIRDVDKDGRAEILCDGNSFVTSKSFKNNGSISDYIETSGNLLVIGDANGDGFDDKVSVTNKETRLYLSRLRYSYGTYMVDYVRTKTTRTNQEKWKNSQNALVFGDINNDGVSEIIHFAGNAKGYQVFVVTNGKTLKDMYVLCPDGVHDYYERFAVQNYDLNSDGYNEIIGSQYYDNIQLFDGKTGEVLLTDIGAYSFGKGFEMDTSFHPDYIVAFNKMEDAEHIF